MAERRCGESILPAVINIEDEHIRHSRHAAGSMGTDRYGASRRTASPGHKPSFQSHAKLRSRSEYEWLVPGEQSRRHEG